MPTYDYDGLLADAATVIKDTWTDVVPNGIWEMDEAIRESWEERVAPYAVFEMSATEEGDWGLVNEADEFELTVYYVARESAGIATVRTKLEALKSAFVAAAWSDPPATLLSHRKDWSRSNELNAVFYEKNVPWIAGSISFRFTAGTTAL